MPDRKSRSRLIAATLCFALGAASGSVALAQGQGAENRVGGVVSIVGKGGNVEAYGARVSVDGAASQVRAAGAVLDIRGAVEGPIWVAGADVTVDAQSGGTVRAAGSHVVIRGRAAEDIMAAGALVEIDAQAGRRIRAAGASVRIGPLSTTSALSAAGANITFEGQATGDVELAGAVVTFNGRADGLVSIHAQSVIVGPRAIIGGDLLVRSINEPQIDPAAAITGQVTRESAGEWFDGLPGASAPLIAAIFAAAIVLAGIVFMAFARGTYGEGVDHVRFRALSSALFGIVAVALLLIVAALLMATAIGLPLGIALLLLLPIVLILGVPVAAAGIIGWMFSRNVPFLGVGRLLLYLIIGALVITFAWLIPVAGPWIVLAALIFGAGGLLRAVLWRFRAPKPAVPEAVGSL